MRSTPAKDEALRQRLAEGVERFSDGSADDFGRKIGYANGGYVREAINRKKPVREALIDRVHAVEEMRGWFDVVLGETSATMRLVQVDAGDNISPGPDIRTLVPLISWVQAGEWSEIEDHFQPGDAERWLACTAAHSEHTYALRVEGDSMQATHGRSYPHGCIIFVDPEKRSPINGQRIVARLDGSLKATFKIYKNEDGRQWLQPLNPSHEPIRDPFSVLGTVIGKWEDE